MIDEDDENYCEICGAECALADSTVWDDEDEEPDYDDACGDPDCWCASEKAEEDCAA